MTATAAAFTDHETLRFSAPKSTSGTVLLIEDDAMLARSMTRLLMAEGYTVEHAASGPAAVEKVMERSFDVVMSDLNLPGASGVDVLNVVRAYDPGVPLVLMTGMPTVETAIEAVSLGVLEYMVKPATREQLVRVLGRAKATREVEERKAFVARQQTETQPEIPAADRAAIANAPTVRPPSWSLREDGRPSADPGASAAPALSKDSGIVPGMRLTFAAAMDSLAVELEPVVDGSTKRLIGFAARMFSTTETLTTERELIEAAERLDELPELRRRVRNLAVRAFADAPTDSLLFVDVHPKDLVDSDLYSPGPELVRLADRIVLQVRGAELSIADLSARASVLRFVGFRLALADLDADQSVAQIAELSPEFVKLDGRLVRGMNASAPRRRIVAALVGMCRALDAVAIAEGVSTAEERDALMEAGCSFVQGSLVFHRRGGAPASRRPLVKSTLRSAH